MAIGSQGKDNIFAALKELSKRLEDFDAKYAQQGINVDASSVVQASNDVHNFAEECKKLKEITTEKEFAIIAGGIEQVTQKVQTATSGLKKTLAEGLNISGISEDSYTQIHDYLQNIKLESDQLTESLHDMGMYIRMPEEHDFYNFLELSEVQTALDQMRQIQASMQIVQDLGPAVNFDDIFQIGSKSSVDNTIQGLQTLETMMRDRAIPTLGDARELLKTIENVSAGAQFGVKDYRNAFFDIMSGQDFSSSDYIQNLESELDDFNTYRQYLSDAYSQDWITDSELNNFDSAIDEVLQQLGKSMDELRSLADLVSGLEGQDLVDRIRKALLINGGLSGGTGGGSGGAGGGSGLYGTAFTEAFGALETIIDNILSKLQELSRVFREELPASLSTLKDSAPAIQLAPTVQIDKTQLADNLLTAFQEAMTVAAANANASTTAAAVPVNPESLIGNISGNKEALEASVSITTKLAENIDKIAGGFQKYDEQLIGLARGTKEFGDNFQNISKQLKNIGRSKNITTAQTLIDSLNKLILNVNSMTVDLSKRFQDLRTQIEKTLDFSTININSKPIDAWINDLVTKIDALSQKMTNQKWPSFGSPSNSTSNSQSSPVSNVSSNSSPKKDNYQSLVAQLREYYRLQKEVEKISAKSSVSQKPDGTYEVGKFGEEYTQRIAHLNNYINQLQQLGITYDMLSKADMFPETGSQAAQQMMQQLGITAEQYAQILTLVQQKILAMQESTEKSGASAQTTWQHNAEKVTDYINRVYAIIKKEPDVQQLANELRNLAATGNPSNLDELTQKFAILQQRIRQTGAGVETWLQKVKAGFSNKLREIFVAFGANRLSDYLRLIYNNVLNLDSALTQLKIVTNENDAVLSKYTDTVIASAKTIGASVADLMSSATTYARLGYTLSESATFAELTAAYANVADTDVNSATTSLTTIIKAFGVEADELEGVLDKMMYVGQYFPISADELGTGFENAGSALYAAGNSLDQSMALLTAANTEVQNINRASTALRTIVARINRSEADLEDLGESIEDVPTTAKLQEDMMAYGISIEDSNGNLRSTYDILLDLSKIWGQLNNSQKSSIAELLSGTRIQSIFFGLMNSFATGAEQVMAEIGNAEGTLSEASIIYADSIEGRLKVLSATFESFSKKFLDGDLVKDVLWAVTGVLSILEDVAKALDGIGGLNTVLITLSAVMITLKEPAIVNILTKVGKFIGDIPSFVSTINTAHKQGKNWLSSMSAAFDVVGVKISATQIALLGITAVIGIAIAVWQSAKSALETDIKNSLTSSAEALSEATKMQDQAEEESESLEKLVAQYEKLYKARKGDTWDDSALTTIKSLQEQIVKAVGDQADGIDLVNGKLQDQLDVLKGITKENLQQEREKAQEAVTDAKAAIHKKTSWNFVTSVDEEIHGDKYRFDEHDDKKNDQAVDIATKMGVQLDVASEGLFSGVEAGIKTTFSDYTDFIKQYEAVQKLKAELANDTSTDWSDTNFYNAAQAYLADYKDIYDAYIEASTLLAEIDAQIAEADKEATEAAENGKKVSKKTVTDILEDVQDGFDAIADALQDVEKYGYITASSLKSLYEEEEALSTIGVNLSEILGRTEEGYTITTDALQKYIQAKIDEYTVEESFDTEQSKKNAIENLTNLQAVLATLIRTMYKESEALNNQKEALEDQRDNYEKLIDLRKELLETYEDEVTYEKELKEKTDQVSKLQTKLAVSKLDTSAAGQARTRELEADLKEAQEELEDFTLEHAVDVITDDLDDQYEEYKLFIDDLVDGIEDDIIGLETSMSGLSVQLDAIKTAIEKTKEQDVVESEEKKAPTSLWHSYEDAVRDGYGLDVMSPESYKRPNTYSTKYGYSYEQYLNEMYKKYGGTAKGDNGYEPVSKVVTSNEVLPSSNVWKTYQDVVKAGQQSNVLSEKAFYIGEGSVDEAGLAIWERYDSYEDYLRDMYNKWYKHSRDKIERAAKRQSTASGTDSTISLYHSGGVVGGVSLSRDTEEFAKLLKGEFVATPQMMNNFMQRTLPSLTASGTNTFNSPLIEINCDNVTSEALPKLKDIVNDAVDEIKKQLDSGMSRTGYKSAAKRLLL